LSTGARCERPRSFWAFLLLLALLPSPAFAAELSSDYILQLARVDLMIRKREYLQAAQELGRVPKAYQSDPLFQKYTDKVVAALVGPNARAAAQPGASSKPPDRVLERIRVTRHKRDANSRSDQSFDPDGLQINQHLEADVEGKDGIRAKFVSDLDGFRDGHNDVRYRTLLADFYDGPSHFGIGDSATFTSPYFLRGSRLRGLDLLLSGPLNEFQAVGGAYPFWRKDRGEYIYPRTVLGARDRWKIFDDRIRLGANFVKTHDNGRIRAIDLANQERDNSVYSLDQELKLIPDVWFLKTAEAYSYTNDDLLNNQNRFGDNKKLRDTSYRVESTLIQPWARWTSRFERTGADFRLLVDLPSGGVLNQKTLTADRQVFENFLDLQPVGPFDLGLQTSWYRNNLDKKDTVEMTRQGWYTANLGILVPHGWPRPRFRATMIDTVSSPGPTSRASQNHVYNLRSELSHYHEGMNFTEFAEYEGEFPQKDEKLFSAEESWSFGTRMSTTLLDRVLVSPHYTYKITDTQEDMFQNGHRLRSVRGTHHEAGISNSIRLWSTASLGLSYTFLRGKLADPNTLLLAPSRGHSGTVSFTWPYTWHSWSQRRKLTLFPGINATFSDIRGGVEKRPILSSELTLAYEVMQNWKAELRGEFLYDTDRDGQNIRTEESRLWMLWTAQWEGEPQWAEVHPRKEKRRTPKASQPQSASSGTQTWEAENKVLQNAWEFGPEIYYFQYKEPDLGVEFSGPMVGLVGSFTHRSPCRLMLNAEGRGAWGRVDYTGSGTISGISDYTFEGRLKTGYDILFEEGWLLTPFFGVGYRYLNDNSSGRTSSTGAVGYKRESNYLYSPLGVSYDVPLRGRWRMGLSAEYDIFWKGTQKSHLEDANPSFNRLSNDQTRGYGARGSVKFQRTGGWIDWAIEPYLRWWNIQNSKSANITTSGVIIGTGYEPRNETLEVGGNVSARF